MMGKMRFSELAKKAAALQTQDAVPPDKEEKPKLENLMEETFFIPESTMKEKDEPKPPKPSQNRKMSGFTRMNSYRTQNSLSGESEFSARSPLIDDSKSAGVSSLDSSVNEAVKPKINPFARRRAVQIGYETEEANDSAGRRGALIDPDQQTNMKYKLKARLRRIVEERLTVKQIFSQYVESSTLHGFCYVASDTYLIRRFLWACLMILGAVYFLVKLKEGIIEYFDYPFSTLSTVDYPENLIFPAISFCLANTYKLEELKIGRLAPLYEAGRFPLSSNWTDPGFDIPGDELRKELERVSLKAEDIFEGCDWIKRDTTHPKIDANKCEVTNFTSYYNVKGQKCFTLNSGKPGHPLLRVTHDGLNYGYDVLFDMRTDLAFVENAFVGLKVNLHTQVDPPVADSGFMLSPGFRYFIKMTKFQTINLEPPYGTNCGEIDLKYFEMYNQKSCLLEKLTDHVGERCHCREPFMPDNQLPLCSLRETILCSFPVKESFNELAVRDECPVDCELFHFEHQMTDASFLHNPPIGVEPTLIRNENKRKKHNTSHLLELVERLTPDELKHYAEDNLIQVIFFFGEISINIHEQEATFDFYQFLGDMGGEIGLMLGASLLTFVEFMDLIIFLIYHQILRLYKQKKIDEIFDDENDKEEDV